VTEAESRKKATRHSNGKGGDERPAPLPERCLDQLLSGFDNDGVDRAFFAGTKVKSNFLCSLGYGDASVLFPRSPRFGFDEMARII
jgi:hypothetical protein